MSCEACGAPLREVSSFPALEGAEEVQVVVWACASCGSRVEEGAPPPDLDAVGPAVRRRVA